MVEITAFYGTTWCSDCKRSKQFLGEHRIPYKWIDIEQDEEAARYVESVNYGKRKVPTIVFSDGSILVEPSNAELAEKLGLVQELGHDFHDVIIIGGGPAGLTAALYAAREGLDVVVVEKGAFGGQIGFTERLDNFPGFPEGISGNELAERFVKQVKRFGVELLGATEIVSVRHEPPYLIAMTSSGKELSAKAMVVATGSKYRTMNVPGEKELIGYKIHFCATCDGPFYRDKNVAVIGGGNSAFEESIFLARFANKVSIIGRTNEWTASAILQEKVAKDPKIETVPNKVVKEFKVGSGKTLEGIVVEDRVTGEVSTFTEFDGVFVFIGLKPNVTAVKDLVDPDGRGFIRTDGQLMTKTPGLFAAGDCRSGSTKQAASAAGEGATVALMVREYLKNH